MTVTNINVSPNQAIKFIEVRSYEKRIVNSVSQTRPTKTENTAGIWKVKYINKVSSEIQKLSEMI